MRQDDEELRDPGFRGRGRLNRRVFLKTASAGALAVSAIYLAPGLTSFSPKTAYAAGTVPDDEPPPGEPPPVDSPLVMDTFAGGGEGALEGRAPSIPVTGSVWSIEAGDWAVGDDGAGESSTVPAIFSADYRALIDTGSPVVQVSATIVHAGNSQLVGVVAGWAGPGDWTMLFYDGAGDLVLGRKRSGEDAGGNAAAAGDPDSGAFQEKGRVSVTWPSGSSKLMSLRQTASGVVGLLDGVQVLPAGTGEIAAPPDPAATHGGLFARGDGEARFIDFAAVAV